MKQILYDMGPLTLVRWLLQKALKFEPTFGPRSKLKKKKKIKTFLVATYRSCEKNVGKTLDFCIIIILRHTSFFF